MYLPINLLNYDPGIFCLDPHRLQKREDAKTNVAVCLCISPSVRRACLGRILLVEEVVSRVRDKRLIANVR